MARCLRDLLNADISRRQSFFAAWLALYGQSSYPCLWLEPVYLKCSPNLEKQGEPIANKIWYIRWYSWWGFGKSEPDEHTAGSDTEFKINDLPCMLQMLKVSLYWNSLCPTKKQISTHDSKVKFFILGRLFEQKSDFEHRNKLDDSNSFAPPIIRTPKKVLAAWLPSHLSSFLCLLFLPLQHLDSFDVVPRKHCLHSTVAL